MELIKGDCIKLLKTIPDKSIDLIVTDPPYSVSYQSNFRKEKFNVIKNDNVIISDWLSEAHRILKDDGALYYFTRWDVYSDWYEKTKDIFSIKNLIVWHKRGGGMGNLHQAYIYNHELCLYCPMPNHQLRGKRISDVFEYTTESHSSYEHPTQKPVKLIEQIILKSSDKGALVLDCFMGSGTTGVACANLQRDFIGMEIDNHYYEIAQKRIKEASAQIQFEFD